LAFLLVPSTVLWIVAIILAIVAICKGDLGSGMALLLGILFLPMIGVALLAMGVIALG